MLVALLTLFVADQSTRPPQAPPALAARAPQAPEVAIVKPTWRPLTYAEGQEKCLKTGHPLVVFVGDEAREVTGFYSALASRGLEGVDGPCVLVCVRDGGKVMLLEQAPKGASDEYLGSIYWRWWNAKVAPRSAQESAPARQGQRSFLPGGIGGRSC